MYKLKTSKETMDIFNKINDSVHLQPYILVKICIALTIKNKVDRLFNTDNDGLELSRQTIMGEYDNIFKALIIQNEGKMISDDLFFPQYVKAYIDTGAQILNNEFRYSGTRIIEHLIEDENRI